MLTTIRDRASGWIAWVIVFIISVPFALWGINEYFRGQEKVVVAEVNGDEMLLQDYQDVLTRRKASLRQQFGRNIDNSLLEGKTFKLRVLNEMINQRLLNEDIRKNNYRISDEQLAEFIRTNENFQLGGKFSADMYASALRRNRLSPVEFENSLRNSNIINQIVDGFRQSTIITPAQIDDMIRMEQEKRDIAYIKLDLDRLAGQVNINDDQVRKHYDENKQAYMTPEAVRVEYVVLSVDELAKQIKPDEAALKEWYEAHKEQYVTPEERRAQHILLAVEGSDPADEARVKAQAEELAKRARDGEDFAALAKKYSTDTISAEKGGDLGFFERGIMLEEFDNKVFSMQPGEISDPVRTSYGYHIIKLNDIKPEKGKSFEEARDEIQAEYAKNEANAQFGQQAEELQNLVYEQPDSLQPAAAALGLKVVQSDWFTRKGGDDGITGKQAFIDAAFSEDVLQEGLNSDVIELDENTLVALRNLDHREPQLRPLEEVADKIRQELAGKARQELASTKIADMVASLKAGRKTLADLAAELGQPLVEVREVGRAGKDDLSPALVKAVFSASGKVASDRLAASKRLDDKTYAIFAVRRVVPGDPANAPEGLPKQMRDILDQRLGGGLFSAYQQGLRERAEVVIYEDKL